MDLLGPCLLHQESRFMDPSVPLQASWVVKKIFSMRKFHNIFGDWKYIEHEGKFVVKKAYEKIRTWSILLSKNPCTLKASFITWLTLQGKIRTKDIIVRWNLGVDPKCVLCGTHDESVPHIFFDCWFTKEVWTAVLSWLKHHRTVLPW